MMINDNDFGPEMAALEQALQELDRADDERRNRHNAIKLFSALERAQEIPGLLFPLGVLELVQYYLAAVSQAAKAHTRYKNAEWAYQQALLRGHKE